MFRWRLWLVPAVLLGLVVGTALLYSSNRADKNDHRSASPHRSDGASSDLARPPTPTLQEKDPSASHTLVPPKTPEVERPDLASKLERLCDRFDREGWDLRLAEEVLPETVEEIRAIVKRDPDCALRILEKRGGVLDPVGSMLRDFLGLDLAKKAMRNAFLKYPPEMKAQGPERPTYLKGAAFDRSLPRATRADALWLWVSCDPSPDELVLMLKAPPDSSYVPMLAARLFLPGDIAPGIAEEVLRPLMSAYDVVKTQPGLRLSMLHSLGMVIADPSSQYQTARILPESVSMEINRWAREEFLSTAKMHEGRLSEATATRLTRLALQTNSVEIQSQEIDEYISVLTGADPSSRKTAAIELLTERLGPSDDAHDHDRHVSDNLANLLADLIPRQTDPEVIRALGRRLARVPSTAIQQRLNAMAQQSPVLAEALRNP